MSDTWRLAVIADDLATDGTTVHGDIGLGDLAEHGITWTRIGTSGASPSAEDLLGFDALLLLGETPFGADQLTESSTLKHVARFGAGFDQVDLAACDSHGITVTNAPVGLRIPMAHAALTLLFALAHNLLPKDRLVREGRWDRKAEYRGVGLANATVGVVGLGGIGRETTRLLRALGIEVVAFNRTPRPEFCQEQGIEQIPLGDLLRRSDAVILTVSANAETKHLIGAPELEAMKPDAFLVNIARGAVVDEDALAQALSNGGIAGAGLDVFETEPLPVSHPLVGLPNTVLTPHSLCWTADFTRATGSETMGEIIAIAEGEHPRNRVNQPVRH